MRLPSALIPRTVKLAVSAALVATIVAPMFQSASADDVSGKTNVARRVDARSNSTKAHPLASAIRMAIECEATTKEIKDYEAIFVKHEIVGTTVINHRMRMKVRHKPFSVYLYFEAPHEGREVIYVTGRNDGNLLAHETGIAGLIGTLKLKPTSETVMSENRYPITRIGMANLVRAIIDQWEAETKFGETEVKYYPNARLKNKPCRVIESTHPHPRRQFSFHRTRLYIDQESGLPVRVEQFGFPKSGEKAPMIEQYTYENVRVDRGLKDVAFDAENPKYGF